MAIQVAEVLGWSGTVVPAVRYAGTTIDIVIRINEGELLRRGPLGAVLDRALLAALMELPLGIEIPLNQLRPEQLLALRIDGDGLVEWTPGGVRRTYEPVCEVTGVLATGPHLRKVVDEVSAFSGYSLRVAYGTRRQCSALRDRAMHLGVGLVAFGEPALVVVAGPEPRGIRSTPSRWQFCEIAFQRCAENVSERAATR